MKRTNGKNLVFVDCNVSLGMFKSERGIRLPLPDGREVIAFVDKRDVEVPQDPGRGQEVSGRVRVILVEVTKDSAVIDLPQPGITEGPRLQVPKALLRYADA